MSKKKMFFSPPQMMILTDFPVTEGTKTIADNQIKPILSPEDENELIIPDGSVEISDGDIIPDIPGDDVLPSDEAYY